MIWRAITTCNSEMWAAYGHRMVETFERFWPAEVSLTVYTEGFAGNQNGRTTFVDLDQAAPWLARWKAARTPEQHGVTPQGYKYRWDAVKFSHKVAAIGATAEMEMDVCVWLDADIVTHAAVTVEWLNSLFPVTADVAWLDRQRCYPECGILLFRMPGAARVIRDILRAYQAGDIFKLQQWHDSYVIETVVKAAEAMGQIKVTSLSGAGRAHHHVLPNSPLAACLDHLKGKRKQLGRTPKSERVVGGGGAYWQ